MQDDIQRFGENADETCLKFSMLGMNPDDVISSIPYVKGYLFLVSLERTVGREAFDPFIRKYIDTHSFKSLTTEGFVAFLQANLPETLKQVDVEAWLYQPGLPGNIPEFQSDLYDEVQDSLQAYQQGARPAPECISRWIPDQVAGFLLKLPETIPLEDCRYFRDVFDVDGRKDSDIKFYFYRLGIRSGCQEVWPDVEAFLERVGRGAYVSGLFRAMIQAEWSRPLARPLFERIRQRYHPIVAGRVESTLQGAGL